MNVASLEELWNALSWGSGHHAVSLYHWTIKFHFKESIINKNHFRTMVWRSDWHDFRISVHSKGHEVCRQLCVTLAQKLQFYSVSHSAVKLFYDKGQVQACISKGILSAIASIKYFDFSFHILHEHWLIHLNASTKWDTLHWCE